MHKLVFILSYAIEKNNSEFFETKKKPELKVEAAQPMPPQMMLKMNTNTASPT